MVGLGTWDELAWQWLPEEPEDVELRKLELQLWSQERIKEEETKAEERREEKQAEERRVERELQERLKEEERKAEERREEKQAEERRVERELQERLAEEERKAEKERAEEERKAEKERAEEERKAEERREEKQAEERRVERELQERLEGRKAEESRAARDLEAEERKAERELKERDMELQQEIKLKELELMRERGEGPPLLTGSTPSQNTWDVGRHVRLVPPFSEKEVAKFFPHFEKVARQLNWPEEAWTILVQSVLVGKAQEIYSALPMDQCADYEVLKKHILKAYELVPEAYRQKFRNARKRESETHVEFARVKENMFDRWCESKGVGKDFETLRDLILVEEFQQCVHEDIKVYLQEKKVPKLWDAATMADDYALTHRIGVHKPNSSPRLQQGSYGTPGAENDNTWRRPREDYGDNADTPPVRNQRAAGPRQTYFSGGLRQTTSFSSGPTCAFCKKPGHLMSSCYLMKREDPERSPTSTTPNAMANVRNRPQKSYQPFIYEGLVSLKGDLTNPRPVRVLRDTGAHQSLMLEGILPLSKSTATGDSVRLQGIGGCVSAPLHVIHLESDLMSGPVTVGLQATLPVEGVSVIIGNDLAGGKIYGNPRVGKEHSRENNTPPAQDGDKSSKLFVGGLNFNTEEEVLTSVFNRFGPLVEVRVVKDRETQRSRGFGFVTFASTRDAREAEKNWNGKDLEGRTITVGKAFRRRREVYRRGPLGRSFGVGSSRYYYGGSQSYGTSRKNECQSTGREGDRQSGNGWDKGSHRNC
uniref:uncharacterized protein n=1 Tax=Myxine glutinosa TaxID=7769 RepID=UPI0035900FA8